ncbi:MAG: ribonuclease H-like domain-containing protein [Anaerolineales bacterium]
MFLESSYTAEDRHGRSSLRELSMRISPDEGISGFPQGLSLGAMSFIDTETTGLSGGTGTLAFLVGIGRFESERFVLRQYFLRDPGEEAAMLEAVVAQLGTSNGLVTFNGRGFDLPILQARATLRLRRRAVLSDVPHLDLLIHARRFWRRRLESCSLSSLEIHALGIVREATDIESALIPEIYREYLQTGEAGALDRVLYHNAIDVLSLVALAGDLFDRYSRELDSLADPRDGLTLAYLYWRQGRNEEAQKAFQSSLRGELPGEDRLRAEWGLGHLLKQIGRPEQATAHWEACHRLAPLDPRPCLELAKYYEWRQRDFTRATEWVQAAKDALAALPVGWQRSAAEGDLLHRLARLERKRTEQPAG